MSPIHQEKWISPYISLQQTSARPLYTGYRQPDLIDFGVLLLVGVATNHLFDRGWNPHETPHSWDWVTLRPNSSVQYVTVPMWTLHQAWTLGHFSVGTLYQLSYPAPVLQYLLIIVFPYQGPLGLFLSFFRFCFVFFNSPNLDKHYEKWHWPLLTLHFAVTQTQHHSHQPSPWCRQHQPGQTSAN